MNTGRSPIPEADKGPPPWGYLGTGGWIVLALLISSIVILSIKDWEALDIPVADNLVHGIPIETVGYGAILAVLAIAVWLRHWRLTDYFALVRPSTHQIAIAVASLVVLLAAQGVVIHLTTGLSTEPSLAGSYISASATGAVPVLWLMVGLVVIAPIAEEMICRGFLYRGWVRTPRTPVPGIVVISVLFAVAHTRQTWFGIFFVFCNGLFFGWARWWGGSTVLAILMHAGNNLYVMVLAVVYVEWPS